jgi:hypothetical protein
VKSFPDIGICDECAKKVKEANLACYRRQLAEREELKASRPEGVSASYSNTNGKSR